MINVKIAYNACYGGFSLSKEAEALYAQKANVSPEDVYGRDLNRSDPILIEVIEELGDKASGGHAKLRLVELPKGTLYRIDEYDGFESVETQDSYEWSVA